MEVVRMSFWLEPGVRQITHTMDSEPEVSFYTETGEIVFGSVRFLSQYSIDVGPFDERVLVVLKKREDYRL